MAHKTSQHIILRMCLVSSTKHEPCISYLIVFRGRHLLFLWPLRETSLHIILRMRLVCSPKHGPCISYLIAFRGRQWWASLSSCRSCNDSILTPTYHPSHRGIPPRESWNRLCLWLLSVQRPTTFWTSQQVSSSSWFEGPWHPPVRRKCISHRTLSWGRWHDYGEEQIWLSSRWSNVPRISRGQLDPIVGNHGTAVWSWMNNRERERVLSRCVADVYVLNCLFKNSKRSLRFALLAQ
jgi:hypothetical protein